MCCENNVNESKFVKYVLRSFDPQYIVMDVLGSYVLRMLARKVVELTEKDIHSAFGAQLWLGMNDPWSFKMGWAAFGIAGTLGAYLGWKENNTNQKQRRIDDVEDTRKRNDMLKAMEEKWKKEGMPAALRKHRPKDDAKKINIEKASETVGESKLVDIGKLKAGDDAID